MSANSESYNGTSWTETNDLNTAKYLLSGSGTSTAALAFAGDTDPGLKAETESWNGTSWTEVNDLNTARSSVYGFGTQTSSLCFGGYDGSNTGKTEDWNGASWAETSDTNSTRSASAGSKNGNTTNGFAFGGNVGGTPYSTVTEEWSGSSSTIKVLTD